MTRKNKLIIPQLLMILALSTITYFLMPNLIPAVNSSPNGTAKPLHFYFHYVSIPVYVDGTEVHYVMNTTNWFKFLTQEEAYANSFYKPTGLPVLSIPFYLYPNLAGPVQIEGTWQIFIWINSSAQHPCGFRIRFCEYPLGASAPSWDSGYLNPTVTSPIGGLIDVPIHCYNLTYAPLAHTFSADSTILAEVELTPSAAADCRVWYDSPMYPSKAIFPCQDYARPSSVRTYDVNYAETNLYPFNWSESKRKVVVRANVTDPFGGYDIYNVNITILDPVNQPVLENVNMIRVSDGQWKIRYSHIYEANWSYPETAMLGNYTVKVSVIDNNGYYHYLKYGTFGPYIEHASHIFNIGVLILYNPTFKVVDDVENPLPRAQVYIRLPNGTQNSLPLYTNDDGFIGLTQVPTGNYMFTILWKDVVVQQTIQFVDSDGPYFIKCRVYQLTAKVLGNNGAPVHGAYVVVYTQAGIVYDFKMTDSSGEAVFQLPSSDINGVGSYRIEVHYSTTYWLTAVTASATEPSKNVTSSGSVTITLTDFPPSIWTTMGFWLLIALIIVAVLGTVGFLYKRGVIFKGKAPKTK